MTFGIQNEASKVLRARFDDAYFKLKDLMIEDTSHGHLYKELLEDLKIIYNQIITDTIEQCAYVQSSINDLQAHTDEMNHFIQGFKEK
jgi:hypothetical protein